MSGIAFTTLEDSYLREQLSLEIIRRRDFFSIWADGLGASSVPISRDVRTRAPATVVVPVLSDATMGNPFNVNNARTGYGTCQFSVSNVDVGGHVHTSPLITTAFRELHHPDTDVNSVGILNHAFLCMDIHECVIGPRMVTYINTVGLSHVPDTAGCSSGRENVRIVEPISAPLVANDIAASQTTFASDDDPLADIPYKDLGDCDQECQHCGALFWYNERLKGNNYQGRPEYHLCCGGGQIYMQPAPEPPVRIKQLLDDRRYIENIRAYNQMFAMTSFGAKIDDSINNAKGPYVFKVSGQIYHWIGSFCPEEGDQPRFLQLYIFDTDDEVNNRLRNFSSRRSQQLSPQIVEDLIHVLDEHNNLVRIFRTARDRCNANDIPGFKIRLYNGGGARWYELPSSDTLGCIVFEDGPKSRTDFDVVIEARGGRPQRVNKLHKSYMSLQFPLLFPHGQPGFHANLMLKPRDARGRGKKV